jgi:hypothetical protein
LRAVVLLFVISALAGAHYPRIVDEERTPQELAQELEIFTILGDIAHSKAALNTGRWRTAREFVPGGGTPDEERERLSELLALPYLSGSREAPPEAANVTVYDQERAFAGINLYTSGHAPAAFAVDMMGRVLHQWRFDIDRVWPDVPRTMHSHFWRRAYWYPNGDILAIFEGIGMIRLNKDSKLLWAYRGGCHHEAAVAQDGRIYVLVRQPEILPDINNEEYVLTDGIAVLEPDGEIVGEYSLMDAFRHSDFNRLLMNMRPRGDLMHTNSIEVLDGSLETLSDIYRRGNLLVSLRKLETIAIVDPETARVVWAASAGPNHMWAQQHDPTVLSQGDILLFDNIGRNGKSRVIEFDPAEEEIVWQYPADDAGSLYSKSCGANQVLPNGNILITESDDGRALEITRAGDTVWEFYNPHRAGDDDRLIATLFEMVRVESDYFPWLRPGE